jgi:hypothetical protein
MGPDVSDPEALQKVCTDIEDHARRIAEYALRLRERIAKHATVKE